ncbi:MAG: glycosyltransferase family 4 protein [Thermoguttaceae bacterium]|jgi:glycosyltransferase involved in cell wall biosynthesis
MKVLALIDDANAVCCRYRIEAFEQAMGREDMRLEIVRFDKGILRRIGNLHKAKQADAVILQRKLLPLWQTSLLRRWSRRLIFDVDDAVFQRDSNSDKGPESRSRSGKFRAIVAKADAVIAGNDYLKQVTAALTAPGRVHFIPTCIDTQKYLPAVHQRVGPEARLVFIGQQTTLRLLDMAKEQLAAIAQRMPGIEFRQICDGAADFPGLRVVLRPWSIETEAAELAECDIGIAWMPDDSWSLGKCGLKVLQYMAASLPVVANPVGIHREMVIHGETGFIASTPQQWAEAVQRLAADPQLRNKLGAAGRYLAEKRYGVPAWAPIFINVIRGDKA